jgi:hypothetical protein
VTRVNSFLSDFTGTSGTIQGLPARCIVSYYHG